MCQAKRVAPPVVPDPSGATAHRHSGTSFHSTGGSLSTAESTASDFRLLFYKRILLFRRSGSSEQLPQRGILDSGDDYRSTASSHLHRTRPLPVPVNQPPLLSTFICTEVCVLFNLKTWTDVMQISAPMLMLSHPHTILSLRDAFRSIKYGARVKCFVAHGLVKESSKRCRHQVPSLYTKKWKRIFSLHYVENPSNCFVIRPLKSGITVDPFLKSHKTINSIGSHSRPFNKLRSFHSFLY